MKKGFGVILLVLFCVMCGVFFWSCGGTNPGSPGSGGSSDTGIEATVTAVTHSQPSGDQGDIWEVDLFMDQCDATTVEKWGNDYAHVTFHGNSLNPNVTSTNELFVTNYTVTFIPTQPGLPPIEQLSYSNQTGIYIQAEQDTGPFNFLIMDTGRKIQLQNDIGFSCSFVTTPSFLQTCTQGGGAYKVSTPLLYNMILQMWGQDNYGNNFTVGPIERVIDISDWNNC